MKSTPYVNADNTIASFPPSIHTLLQPTYINGAGVIQSIPPSVYDSLIAGNFINSEGVIQSLPTQAQLQAAPFNLSPGDSTTLFNRMTALTVGGTLGLHDNAARAILDDVPVLLGAPFNLSAADATALRTRMNELGVGATLAFNDPTMAPELSHYGQ